MQCNCKVVFCFFEYKDSDLLLRDAVWLCGWLPTFRGRRLYVQDMLQASGSYETLVNQSGLLIFIAVKN
jgi:hypothetical protein